MQITPSFRANEPIWKLRLEVVPCTLASIDPADLWIAPALLVPRRPVFDRAAVRFSRHGVTMRLRGIAGSWANVPMDDNVPPIGESGYDGMTVHLMGSPQAPGLRLLLVRAVDEHGRSIQPPGIGDTSDVPGGCVFRLHVAPSATKVTLVFAVVRSRFVEFVVRPSHTRNDRTH